MGIIHESISIRDSVRLRGDDETFLFIHLKVPSRDVLFNPLFSVDLISARLVHLLDLFLQLLNLLLRFAELDCIVSRSDFVKLLLFEFFFDHGLSPASLKANLHHVGALSVHS